MLHPEEVEGGIRPFRRWWRWTGYVVAMVLLGWAVYMGARAVDWDKAREAEIADGAMLMGLVVVSLVLNAVLFWMITKPFEKKGMGLSAGEWVALVSGTSLLNYLPMRAGLVGRIAYMKQQHGITVKGNMATLAGVAAGTTGVYGLLAALTIWRGSFDGVWWVGLVIGLCIGVGISYPLLVLGSGRFGTMKVGPSVVGWIGIWYVIRVVDSFCFAGRFYLASKMLGYELGFEASLTMGVICNFAVLATPVPGGMGIREWLGGFLAELGVLGGSAPELKEAIAILVADRAGEVLVFTVMGSIGLWYLHGRVRKREKEERSEEAVS